VPDSGLRLAWGMSLSRCQLSSRNWSGITSIFTKYLLRHGFEVKKRFRSTLAVSNKDVSCLSYNLFCTITYENFSKHQMTPENNVQIP
jgi:hypothetical protein